MCAKRQLIKILNKGYLLMTNLWVENTCVGLGSSKVCVWTVIIQLRRDFWRKALGPLLCLAGVGCELRSSPLCSAMKCRHPCPAQPGRQRCWVCCQHAFLLCEVEVVMLSFQSGFLLNLKLFPTFVKLRLSMPVLVFFSTFMV